MMKSKISRREMIQKALAGFGAAGLPVGLTACGSDDDQNGPPVAKVQFLHGVASGDPQQNRVIIWTRITPEDESLRLELAWEVSQDEQFKTLVSSGKVQTSSAVDFTVNVDAAGLKPAQRYFYRFKFGNAVSAVGQTKTLPASAEQVSFAVCSCANYPAGYFHVYKEMAKQNVDAVLHLGDYIYEYGQGGYATENAQALGRTLAPDNNKELLNLADYRKRYALYRLDADLQAAHQRHPFIVIWDDHELANDAWRDGADNHQQDEGDFYARKTAALQAYFEWMPIRPKSANDHLNIYRQFDFGNLVQLNMLDTRILARSEQLQYKDYLTADGLDAQKFGDDLYSKARTMLGPEQLGWLHDSLAKSSAKWNVLGQQVLMSRMWIPAEILLMLEKVQSGQAGPSDLLAIKQMIAELSAIKIQQLTAPGTLTEEQLKRINTAAPYNLDAWDGYAYEREVLYGACKALKKKVVVLAGDTHNAWHSALHDKDGAQIGIELAASSVSSPGLEKYLQISDADLHQFEQAFSLLIDELKYCNLNQRGYLKVSFDAQQVKSEWIFVDTVQQKAYSLDASKAETLLFDAALQPVPDLAETA